MENRFKLFEIDGVFFYLDTLNWDIYAQETAPKNAGSDLLLKNEYLPAHLAKVTINLANTCNLKCVYCYANFGNYGANAALLNAKSLEKIIADLKRRNIKSIGTLSLFGGEPLSNNRILEATLEVFTSSFSLENIELVTNGTLITPTIAHLLGKYEVNLTLSIDGPEFIHDQLRGAGTYKKVLTGLQVLQSANIKNITIAATYTRVHQRNGITRLKLSEFLSQFNLPYEISTVRVPEAQKDLQSSTEQTILRLEGENALALDALYHNRGTVKVPYYLDCLLSAFILKTISDNYCRDLDSKVTLAYDYDGTAYNCFHFWSKPEFALEHGTRVPLEISDANSKLNTYICKTCWARRACKQCTANLMQDRDVISPKSGTCIDLRAFEISIKQLCLEFINGRLQEIIDNYYAQNTR